MVRQGDEQGLVQGDGQLGFDVLDQILGEPQVLNGNLLAQLPELPLLRLALHAIGLLELGGVHPLPDLPLKAQALSSDDHLSALVVHHAEDVVVDDFFDPHPPPPSKKTNQPRLPISENLRR